VFLSDLRASLVREPFYHYVVTGAFEVDEETWKKRLLDAGPQYKDDNGKKIAFRDDNKVLFGGIGLLDGTGKKLASDAAAHWLTFQTIRKADFNSLKLVDKA
jgi:hypothetical protein